MVAPLSICMVAPLSISKETPSPSAMRPFWNKRLGLIFDGFIVILLVYQSLGALSAAPTFNRDARAHPRACQIRDVRKIRSQCSFDSHNQ
jgi:hypothetical protein